MRHNQKFTLLGYYFILLFLVLFSCGGEDMPESGDPLDFPNSCENYRFEISSGTIGFSFSAPNFVSADSPNQLEQFYFKATPLDADFNPSLEDLQAINYSFFDAKGNVIVKSTNVPTLNSYGYDLWNVKINDAPFYGKFTYSIEFTYDSGTIIGEGEAFAVSCELIEKCCAENSDNCAMFFDTDNCAWGSNIRLGNQQSNFAVACCQ